MGGIGNTSPGIVALGLPYIISYWSVQTAYIIGIIIFSITMLLCLYFMSNSPFHQLKHKKINYEDNVKICKEVVG